MTIFPGTLHEGFPVNGTSGFDKLCGRAVYSFQSCVAPSEVMSSIAKSCRSLRSRQVIPTSSQCRREVSIIKSIVLPFSLRFIATKCACHAFFRHDTVFHFYNCHFLCNWQGISQDNSLVLSYFCSFFSFSHVSSRKLTFCSHPLGELMF